MEAIATVANAYGKTCIGCEKFKRDIMVSFMVEGKETDFFDFFLTDEQARRLLQQLKERLDQNKSEEINSEVYPNTTPKSIF